MKTVLDTFKERRDDAEARWRQADAAKEQALKQYGNEHPAFAAAWRETGAARAQLDEAQRKLDEVTPKPAAPRVPPPEIDWEGMMRRANPLYAWHQDQNAAERAYVRARQKSAEPAPEPFAQLPLSDDDRAYVVHCLDRLGRGFCNACRLDRGFGHWQLFRDLVQLDHRVDLHVAEGPLDGFTIGKIVVACRPGGRAWRIVEAMGYAFDMNAARQRLGLWTAPRPAPTPTNGTTP
jgi:hypothetical protein